MFFKKRKEANVDVLEKIKERIVEDEVKKATPKNGTDEDFLSDVFAESEVIADNTNETKQQSDVGSEVLEDINKVIQDAVKSNDDEVKINNSSDDDFLDALLDEGDDEEKDDNSTESGIDENINEDTRQNDEEILNNEENINDVDLTNSDDAVDNAIDTIEEQSHNNDSGDIIAEYNDNNGNDEDLLNEGADMVANELDNQNNDIDDQNDFAVNLTSDDVLPDSNVESAELRNDDKDLSNISSQDLSFPEVPSRQANAKNISTNNNVIKNEDEYVSVNDNNANGNDNQNDFSGSSSDVVKMEIKSSTKNNVKGSITDLIENVKNQMLMDRQQTKMSRATGKTIEQFMADLIQPKIVEYLDQNLDKIVKDVVKQEIQKIVDDVKSE